MPFDPKQLTTTEVFWRDHQKWLQDKGYMLRPRYMPDWKPSWLENGDGRRPMEYEDAQPLHVRYLRALDHCS